MTSGPGVALTTTHTEPQARGAVCPLTPGAQIASSADFLLGGGVTGVVPLSHGSPHKLRLPLTTP